MTWSLNEGNFWVTREKSQPNNGRLMKFESYFMDLVGQMASYCFNNIITKTTTILSLMKGRYWKIKKDIFLLYFCKKLAWRAL